MSAPRPLRPDAAHDIALGAARASSPPRRYPGWIGPTFVAVLFALLAVLGLTLNLGAVTTLSTVVFYVAIAQGWNLLGGFGGYLNFGAAFFVGGGAYTAAWLNSELGWSVWATFVPAAAVAVVLSVIVGVATLRLRSHYFAIFTLIITFLAVIVVRNAPALGGASGIFTSVEGEWTPRSLAGFFFFLLLALAVVSSAVAWRVQGSNFGYALRAIKEDEPAAQVLGVKTVPVKLQALVIGAAIAGVAGAIYAFQIGYIEPAGAFDFGLSLDIVLVCVIGGLGTWIGPLIGAVLVVVIEQVLRVAVVNVDLFGYEIPSEINRLVLGLIMVVFALFVRRGIIGLFVRRRGRSVAV